MPKGMDLSIKRSVCLIVSVATPESAVAILMPVTHWKCVTRFLRTGGLLGLCPSVTAYPFQSPQDQLWFTLIGLDTMVVMDIV
jgi:hypothetical protein